MSGFTKLSESLAKKGDMGAEELGFYLNRYFERVGKLVAKAGGDIIKFAGDALLVMVRSNQIMCISYICTLCCLVVTVVCLCRLYRSPP